MTDHFRDSTKKMDFVSGEAVIKEIKAHVCFDCAFKAYSCTPEKCGTNAALKAISEFPAADVVSHDCYDRILAENDTMREMLAQIGKKPGDKMDDVQIVNEAHWIYHEDDYGDYYECSDCHDEYVVNEGDMTWKRCPTCGAIMTEAKDG